MNTDEILKEFLPSSGIQILNETITEVPTLNRPPGAYVAKQELPHHRAAIELAAKGCYTQKEIASMLGKTPLTVSNVTKNPNYQRYLADAIHRIHGEDEEVLEIIKEGVTKAAQLLVNVVKDKDAKNSDRIAAAKELLDRKYGKPNQPVNRGTDVDLNAMAIAELAAKLPRQN